MNSEKVELITPALLSVQKALAPAKQDGKNDHFKNKYATLESIWEVARQPLQDNKLVLTSGTECPPGQSAIFWMMLLHESGQFIRSELPLAIAKQDAQGIGSAITYFRRYLMASMLGITQEDDDGNAASGRAEVKTIPPQKPAPANERASSAQQTPRPAQAQSPQRPAAAKTEDPKPHQALLESAASEAALKLIWDRINKTKTKFSAEDYKALGALKDARKKEFAEAGK